LVIIKPFGDFELKFLIITKNASAQYHDLNHFNQISQKVNLVSAINDALPTFYSGF
jgi:hypothetical protein